MVVTALSAGTPAQRICYGKLPSWIWWKLVGYLRVRPCCYPIAPPHNRTTVAIAQVLSCTFSIQMPLWWGLENTTPAQ